MTSTKDKNNIAYELEKYFYSNQGNIKIPLEFDKNKNLIQNLVILLIVIIFSEILSLYYLDFLNVKDTIWEPFLDGFLLLFILIPVFYFLLYIPPFKAN